MKKITLTRLIATIGCLLAAASLSVFLFMYSDRTEPETAVNATAAENPRIVTPKAMGSYGLTDGRNTFITKEKGFAITSDNNDFIHNNTSDRLNLLKISYHF